jgi:hypothetical protein
MIAAIAFLALSIGSVYAMVVYRWRRDRAWDWWNAAISTVVSVTLATATGIYLFRAQSAEQDAQDRARWKDLVVAEYSELRSDIAGNSMNVNITESGVRRTVPIFITYVQPIATEQAALSGKFSPATSERLLELATAARGYDMKATYALQLLAQGVDSPDYADRLAHASRNLEFSRENIRRYLSEVTDLMTKQ